MFTENVKRMERKSSFFKMLQLFLHDEDEIKRIEVDSLQPVQTVDEHAKPGRHKYLYYNNNVLYGGFSFEYYNIQDGAHIFILRVNEKTAGISTNLMKNRSRPKLLRSSKLNENCRILDVAHLKDELNNVLNRKIIQYYQNHVNHMQLPDSDDQPTILGSSPSIPTQALPRCWD